MCELVAWSNNGTTVHPFFFSSSGDRPLHDAGVQFLFQSPGLATWWHCPGVVPKISHHKWLGYAWIPSQMVGLWQGCPHFTRWHQELGCTGQVKPLADGHSLDQIDGPTVLNFFRSASHLVTIITVYYSIYHFPKDMRPLKETAQIHRPESIAVFEAVMHFVAKAILRSLHFSRSRHQGPCEVQQRSTCWLPRLWKEKWLYTGIDQSTLVFLIAQLGINLRIQWAYICGKLEDTMR